MTRLTLPPDLCRRVLGLPTDTCRVLAYVPGPGWRIIINPSGGTPYCYDALHSEGVHSPGVTVWWPANPAAAVCAVCDVLPHAAHQLIADACPGLDEGDDDHAAALEVIEAHLRERP